MTEKITFISGCNSNYFPMLREWIHSVRRFKESENIDINILDAGLTTEQIAYLKPLVTSIVAPDFPPEIPAHKIRNRTYLKGCICRPFINTIFPGYDLYLWMDADIWIQDWAGIALYLEGARRKKLAIAAQVHRSWPKVFRIKWLGRWPWKVRGFYFSNALRALGFKTAKALLPCPVLQAGIFALHKDAPHWAHWQDLAVKAACKGKVFTAEQLTLGIMVYRDGFSAEILPAWTNWLCEFKPLWDKDRGVFVEPHLPHQTLSAIHLSGLDDMRRDRSLVLNFDTTDGDQITMSYRYPHLDGEQDI